MSLKSLAPTLAPCMMTDGIEVGLDEAGRGPCFGRLYTAAVIWPSIWPSAGPASGSLIRDSKTLKPKQITEAFHFIQQHAVEWHVTYAEHDEVDKYGPLEADIRSLHRCLDLFNTEFDRILMDGNYFKPYTRSSSTSALTYHTVIGGDSKYLSIAAASIVAKYHRDQYIFEMCRTYPLLDTRYDLSSNKGYLTPKHKEGIRQHGISEFHRTSYKCCKGHLLRSCKTRIKPIIVSK